ncbi:MAG: hypothetical protein LBT33_08580, partial [Spirochaetia bacterium]|nr:hypothetical protein [Spirochaetia bacterium]
LDTYSDYLLYSGGQTAATGLSNLPEGEVSHDKLVSFGNKDKPLAPPANGTDGELAGQGSKKNPVRMAAKASGFSPLPAAPA